MKAQTYKFAPSWQDRLDPDIRVEADPLGKQKQSARWLRGVCSASFLEVGCEKVLVVWDLYPLLEHEGDPCSTERFKERILESLIVAGISCFGAERRAHMCIEAELETWLLADYTSSPRRAPKVESQCKCRPTEEIAPIEESQNQACPPIFMTNANNRTALQAVTVTPKLIVKAMPRSNTGCAKDRFFSPL